MKTSELTGPALDWAVARCEGEAVHMVKGQLETLWTDNGWKPSTDWALGGPILERERIDLYFIGHDAVDNGLPIWRAEKLGEWGEDGPTPLVAAMRCYVGSVIGNEVEIPEELK